jgi:hypothetical protein
MKKKIVKWYKTAMKNICALNPTINIRFMLFAAEWANNTEYSSNTMTPILYFFL